MAKQRLLVNEAGVLDSFLDRVAEVSPLIHPRELEGMLATIIAKLDRQEIIMLNVQEIVENLVRKVEVQDTIIDSAAALIASFPATLRQAIQDIIDANPHITVDNLQTLVDVADQIDANTAELAAALAANTPAAPPVVEEPAPVEGSPALPVEEAPALPVEAIPTPVVEPVPVEETATPDPSADSKL